MVDYSALSLREEDQLSEFYRMILQRYVIAKVKLERNNRNGYGGTSDSQKSSITSVWTSSRTKTQQTNR